MAYRTIEAAEKALIKIVLGMSEDDPVLVLRDNAKVQQRSLLGKLVVFFQANPDEHCSIEDIEVKYEASDITPETIMVNLRRGLLARIFSGKKVDGRLHIFPGPHINALKVCEQRPHNRHGGERIKTSSLMYDILVRLKSDPTLVLETAKLGIPNARFVPTFRFAIHEGLIEVFWDRGVRYFKASPKLMQVDYIQSEDAPMWALLSRLTAFSANSRPSRNPKFTLTASQSTELQKYLEQTLKKGPTHDDHVSSPRTLQTPTDLYEQQPAPTSLGSRDLHRLQ
jgi:hypothetical protein